MTRLAALRRGLGRPPGTVPEMHPHVQPFLAADGLKGWREDCCYIVAALLASHPDLGGRGNLGDTMRRLSEAVAGKPGERADSVERRFIALLKADREDLFGHLRHAVSLAKAKEVPVNYDRLLRDIRNWDSDQRWVQRNWARAFWGSGSVAGHNEPQPANTGE